MKSKITLLVIVLNIISSFSFGQYTKLHEFDYSTNGAQPLYSNLISDGTYLYGLTSNGGGAGSTGIVFRIKPDGADFQSLYQFDTASLGSAPYGSLLAVGDYLYGTTSGGGDFNRGTVFRIKPDGTDFSKIADFDGDNGQAPKGGLYFDGTYLYGTTTSGGLDLGGTLFKLLPDATSEIIKIFDFIFGTTTGNNPFCTLVSDGTSLYGTTPDGGLENAGVIFKIHTDGLGYTNLYEFSYADDEGIWPYGSLFYDGSEYLYGMASSSGGDDIEGTIYRIKTDGSGFEVIYYFDIESGQGPLGSLILQGTTFYGLTGGGGSESMGTMFSIETDGSNFQKLIDFDGANGASPNGGLFFEDGAFFGMTTSGGANNYGTIFRYGDLIESVNEINISELDMYPNPAENFLTISLPQTSKQFYQIEITNVMGEKMFAENISSGNHEISVSDFPGGMYLVKASDGENVYMNNLIVE